MFGKGNIKLYNEQLLPRRDLLAETLSVFDGDGNEYAVFPGFCDVHVHFREPGFSYKETVRSGSMAAARGGYTAVCAMPNLNPVPDSAEHLSAELDIIKRSAVIKVLPYGAISVGEKGLELADLEAMANSVVAFSDDGKGVQSEELMRQAMLRSKSLGKLIAAHCEDESLLHGGYIHAGAYAAAHGHAGICSESEWGPIARDIELAKKTGCGYHVCHISCRESVDLIRKAKAEGVDITCETAPHYLLMDESFLEEDGRFKMNPPLRTKEDRQALIEGIQDGTIDMIATDHAPHSAEEKSRGLKGSSFGIVGIETAFPLLYTYLVRRGVLSLERLIELLAINPRRRFGIGFDDSFTLWKMNEKSVIDSNDFISMGKATPFEGWEIYGKCCLTALGGKTVYDMNKNLSEEK